MESSLVYAEERSESGGKRGTLCGPLTHGPRCSPVIKLRASGCLKVPLVGRHCDQLVE